jgi:signal transduction histidine kinase
MTGWPHHLLTALRIMVGSRFPMQLLWGDDYIHFYNDAYVPIAAEKHPKALGQPGAAIWPEIWADVLPQLEHVKATGEATWSDNLLLLLDRRGYREECYFTFSYSPLQADDGSVDGIFVTVTETTRQVLSERRLESLARLSTALSGELMRGEVLGAIGSALAQNHPDLPFAQLYLVDESTGELDLAYSVGTLPPGAEPEAGLLAETIWSGRLHLHGPRSNGVDLPSTKANGNLALLLPLLPGDGSTALGCLVAGLSERLPFDADYRDFLERLAIHVTRALASMRLLDATNQAVRIRDDYLSIAAHELKNPLTPILGKLQLLERRLGRAGVDEKHVAAVASVAADVQRFTAIVDTLLDLSRLRSGQLTLAREPVDLRDVARQVVGEVEETLAQHTLVLELPPEPTMVYGDALRLTQVLRNLVSNAVKYSPGGGMVNLAISAQEGSVVLAVRDEGIGIAPEVIPQLFERYYRVDSADTASIGGMGIGLFVAHEIVRHHGGTLRVTSTPGRGSTFALLLPQLKSATVAEGVAR